MSEIKYDEWLAEYQSLEAKFPEGFTTSELAAAFGVGVGAARVKLKRLFAAGRAIHAGQRTSISMDGKACHIPVYRLVKRKK